MSGFSPAQLKKLTGKLDRARVQTRCVEGRQLDYIEGWFALSEANAIFGFANWDRETVHLERLFERTRGEMTSCAYAIRVRIRVRAGKQIISREGTGCGSGSARNAADAHDLAIKAAETDASKRALATFGNRFGLCLYDKDQAGVTDRHSLEVLCPDGTVFAGELSPEGFCTALRKIIESTADQAELGRWRDRNADQIERLRSLAPELKTQRGEHYADVLVRLFQARLPVAVTAPTDPDHGKDPPQSIPAEISEVLQSFPLAASRIAYGPRIDKAALTFKTVRRLRDKAHLLKVGSLPCLICGRHPSHAHHLRFAQPPGLSQKVSDEFVVPLCFVHHGELHAAGSERDWWHRLGLEPLAVAAQLWAGRVAEQQSDARSERLSNSDEEGINFVSQ